MTDVVNAAGNWIFTHELCEACGCPSWDAYPKGVVKDRWSCQRCGHTHRPHKRDAREGLAIVARIEVIEPHPRADRLDLMRIEIDPETKVWLVSGKHYRQGDLGVWLRPDSVLPGWLARQLWLPVVDDQFLVRSLEFQGIRSPGVWAGEWYRNDKAVESKLNSKARAQGADHLVNGWLHWGPFKDAWKPGDVVDAQLGVVHDPRAQLEEA